VADAGVSRAAVTVRDTVRAALDYEFRRNVNAGLGASEVRGNYAGVDRNDRRKEYRATIDFAVNRSVAIASSLFRVSLDSSGVAKRRTFATKIASVTLRLRRQDAC